MVGKWIEAFTLNSFAVMSYLYTFTHNPETVPKRYSAGFPRNIVQYAFLTRCPGVHLDGFVPQSEKRFIDIDYTSMTDSATISNIVWPAEKLTNVNTRKLHQKSEKCVAR